MLKQKHQFGSLPVGDIGSAGLHFGDGLGVGHRIRRNAPFDVAAARRPREGRQIKALAVINHWLTITWSGGTTQFSPPLAVSKWPPSIKSALISWWCSAPRPCPSTR